jgi:tetratricopeptide (TPR) repeat protein
MKTKVILTLCVVFVWGLVSIVSAQVVAGSPEDKAFQLIDAENNVDAKINLLSDFEKQYPQSKALREVYLLQITIYQQKNDQPKIIEAGEKLIKVDADNLSGLLTLSRAYSLERKNLDRAVQYAQKAVDITARLKTQPPQNGYSDEQWKQYLESNEQLARSYLSYARSLRP